MFDWYTSDWHLNHAKTIQLEGRDFATVQEMNEALIERYNKVVAKHDTVCFLGDFAFGSFDRAKEVRERLNGHITLVRNGRLHPPHHEPGRASGRKRAQPRGHA